MTTRVFRRLVAGLGVTLVSGLMAQEPTPEFDPLGEQVDAPQLIRVQVEFVEMAHETLTKLLLEPRKGANDADMRKQVQKLVDEQKATVVETMLCTGRSGEKSLVESIKEFIYPTEYEPAEMPNEIHTTADGEKVKSDGKEYATGPTPTSFETRNLGSTLEVEPTVGGDGKIIDLRFSPDIVHHVGNETWAEWKGKHGDASIRMPTMYSTRLTTSVTLAAGQPLLVAALSPKGENGFPDFKRKLVVFVRCDVLTVGR